MNLEELKSQLLKQSKGNYITTLGEDKDMIWLTSPAKDLNRILSGSLYNSVQIGNHTAIIGPEASGKSSFMALMLADAQKKGYLPVVIDAEGAWEKSFVERWGIDANNVIRIKSLFIEDVLVEFAKFIDNGYTNLAIAIDSIGALESKKMIRDGVEGDVKADQGRLQKDIKRFLKMLVSLTKFNECISFSAGHYYGNPTGYGEPEKVGGGHYYKLSADIIITLKKYPIFTNPSAKTKKDKGEIIGTSIKAATMKNRKYPPFQECTVNIDFKNGVDELAGLFDVAKDIGLIEQSGAWYTCDILSLRTQGESKFYNELRNMDYQPLLDKIEEYIKTTGYSSINTSLELQEEQKEELSDVEVEEKLDDENSKKNVEVTKLTKKKPGRPKKDK